MVTTKKTKEQNKSKSITYRVSRVIVSLTLLGSLWRTALFAATLLAIVVLAGLSSLVEPSYSIYVDSTVLIPFISFTLAFAVYDLLYGYIVRRYREIDIVDKIILFGLESVVLFNFLIHGAFSSFAPVRQSIYDEAYAFIFWTVVLALIILPLRAFVGVSYVVMTRKTKQ